ncbi:helix-hairpin-helix domain-containing protein [uncultured Limosilactobacillus sp.]|uniref:helix-hairpin-helix domain-containing protein n=1 Tax=uncultured Limosilactobacillus sp. TaxID=2837629 RepID=UPI0025DE24BA|nr:helix-hairpin-helix domain-containing protein [uncultured Limosilactobacillus sp.]
MKQRLFDLYETYKREILIGFVGGLVILGLFIWHGRQQPTEMPMEKPATQVRQTNKTDRKSGKVFVDVKGAVNKPGVYELRRGSRIAEAVNQAGGFRPDADNNQVNLAKQVNDQQMIYIPMKGEQVAPNDGSLASGQQADSNSQVVNLNTATKEQLTTITGIGDKKADLILAYRQQHGQFSRVEDLKNITGFGDKTIAKIKDQLSV